MFRGKERRMNIGKVPLFSEQEFFFCCRSLSFFSPCTKTQQVSTPNDGEDFSFEKGSMKVDLGNTDLKSLSLETERQRQSFASHWSSVDLLGVVL